MNGVLVIDKPEAMTSADVVRVVKHRLRCKTGHLGTLDPFATGVLPLCVGEGTKIAQFLSVADKEYTGVIRLGSATDTGDPTGTIIATAPVPRIDGARLAAAAHQLCGESLQIPPMHSAIKRNGTPLYKLARQGIVVDRQPRPIRIDALDLFDSGEGRVSFCVACSKGTYIRVLAQEVAQLLGTVGYLEKLRRSRFGPFKVENATTLPAFEAGVAPVVDVRNALPHLREIVLDAAATQRARRGYEPMLARIGAGRDDEAVKLIGSDGLVAAIIVRERAGRWRFARVLADGEGIA